MNDRTIRLIDSSRQTLATARIGEKGGRLAGSIDLGSMPLDLLRRFEAYEEIVNGQMFGLLDEIEEEIGAIPLMAVFDDGRELLVEDLQIYPGSGRISFKIAERSSEHPGPIGDAAPLDIVPLLPDDSRVFRG